MAGSATRRPDPARTLLSELYDGHAGPVCIGDPARQGFAKMDAGDVFGKIVFTL
jgi:hypothetical protein